MVIGQPLSQGRGLDIPILDETQDMKLDKLNVWLRSQKLICTKIWLSHGTGTQCVHTNHSVQNTWYHVKIPPGHVLCKLCWFQQHLQKPPQTQRSWFCPPSRWKWGGGIVAWELPEPTIVETLRSYWHWQRRCSNPTELKRLMIVTIFSGKTISISLD